MKVLWNSNWGSYFYYLDAWNSLFHVLFCLWEYHLLHPSLALSSTGSAESRSRHCPNCLVLVDVSQKFLLQIQAPQTLSHRYLGHKAKRKHTNMNHRFFSGQMINGNFGFYVLSGNIPPFLAPRSTTIFTDNDVSPLK